MTNPFESDLVLDEPWQARPVYVPEGDCLTFYMDDRLCHGLRVNDIVTAYVADADDALVGCEIKGVSRMLNQYGPFGVALVGQRIRLGFLFLMAGVEPDSPLFAERLAEQEIEIPDLSRD